jgi:hypothetical protein
MKRTLYALAATAIAAAAFVVIAPFAGARTTATTVHVQARDTLKKGKHPYKCTVPGHAAAGMKGVFTST